MPPVRPLRHPAGVSFADPPTRGAPPQRPGGAARRESWDGEDELRGVAESCFAAAGAQHRGGARAGARGGEWEEGGDWLDELSDGYVERVVQSDIISPSRGDSLPPGVLGGSDHVGHALRDGARSVRTAAEAEALIQQLEEVILGLTARFTLGSGLLGRLATALSDARADRDAWRNEAAALRLEQASRPARRPSAAGWRCAAVPVSLTDGGAAPGPLHGAVRASPEWAARSARLVPPGAGGGLLVGDITVPATAWEDGTPLIRCAPGRYRELAVAVCRDELLASAPAAGHGECPHCAAPRCVLLRVSVPDPAPPTPPASPRWQPPPPPPPPRDEAAEVLAEEERAWEGKQKEKRRARERQRERVREREREQEQERARERERERERQERERVEQQRRAAPPQPARPPPPPPKPAPKPQPKLTGPYGSPWGRSPSPVKEKGPYGSPWGRHAAAKSPPRSASPQSPGRIPYAH